MVKTFSKTFELTVGLCCRTHGPVHSTVLKNSLVWLFCSHVKTLIFKAGPRSPTSPVTAQLVSRRWRIISFWCYADFHQCSIERMVVFHQTRSRSFDDMEKFFRLVGKKFFKNIRTYGWAVLPQTQPKILLGVEKLVRLDVMQTFKNIQVHGWAALPNIPCHGPADFAALKNHFVLMLCKLSTTFNWTNGRAPSNTVQIILRFCKTFSFGW